MPLSTDGTFRIQVPFRDGEQMYAIEATASDGEQSATSRSTSSVDLKQQQPSQRSPRRVVLNPSDPKAPASLRWIVAITPLAGAMVFPLVVPLVMARVGIGAGVGVALVLSGVWFVAMLKTSEMPH